ncbi:MAG: carboxypeptidase-like regulatory domain-containing protein [Gemmatimonadaceae bacterium]
MRALAIISLVVAAPQAAAQIPEYRIQSDTIRGRVTTDSAQAIADAEVIVTMAPDRVSKFAKTDAVGRYHIVFEQGTGDYLVYVKTIGRQTFRRRITRDSTESVFDVDATLKPEVQALADVRIEARPQRPSRAADELVPAPGAGAAERAFDGLIGALSPDLQGDLGAMAATMPGISATSTGASALGLPPEQNTTTLNGLAFGGAELPRGLRSVVRAATSTYDPARGGFSGIETAVSLTPGGFLTSRRATAALDMPWLQTTDAIGARAGQRRAATDVNLGGDGNLLFERWFFNSGLRLTRSVADAVSIADADASVLRAAGVSPDSAERFRSLLSIAGVPADGTTAVTSQVSESFTLAGRIDRPAFDFKNFVPLRSTWGITGYANRSLRSGLSLSPTAPASHGGRGETDNYALQGFYSRYFGASQLVLNDTRTGLTLSGGRSQPYVEMPDGRVRVASTFEDGSSSVGWLNLGGHGGFNGDTRALTWQTTSETHFYWKGRPAHRGKIYAETRLDNFSGRSVPNPLGTFTYHSLEEFEANRPASFTRTLAWPNQSAGRWTGVLAVSDLWRRHARFRVLYGARLEAIAFRSKPAYNQDVERTFGVRTDHAPRTFHVSPRAGFTWVYTRARATGESLQFTSLGQFYNAPRGVLRGGVGEFRGTIDPSDVAEAAAHTGLPGSMQQLACIGEAVPEPEWGLYAAGVANVPVACAGSGTPSFIDDLPRVRLFDRSFQPPRSWRANLSWSSVLLGMIVSADGIVSLNLNQPSRSELNFSGTQRFTLVREGDRPVFALPASIVPSTGAVASVDARRSTAFGSVLAQRSDLRSFARQLTVIARPDARWYGGRYVASLAYTHTRVRSQKRGFDGATFVDPTTIEWARGDFAPRHEFIIQMGVTTRPLSIALFGKIASGTPFTPMVGADINGDGLPNDRAFVFNPATMPDLEVAGSIQSLLDDASTRVRSCLSRQLGRVAARNSCEGPWTSTLNARVGLNQPLLRKLGVPQRASVALSIANPLGGLDRLLHGSSPRGWGSPSGADPVLYVVQGFDPSERAFRYRVNPRFGDSRPATSTLRVPFRITLDVSLDLARPHSAQYLDRLAKPGRAGNPGPRYTAEDLKKRYERGVPDPYSPIIQQSDSLLLTRTQAEAIAAAQMSLRARLDSLWLDLSQFVASLPDRYNSTDALRRQEETIDEAWESTRLDVQRVLPQILTPIQLRLLPYPASMLYNAKEKVTARMYM